MGLLTGLGFLAATPTEASEAAMEKFVDHFWKAVPDTVASVMGWVILILPVLMLVTGVISLVCPPKEANWIIGYRTRRAMGTDESWFFAQKLRGILWSACGLILLIPSLVVRGMMKEGTMDFVLRMTITYCLIQAAVLLLCLLAMRIVMVVRYDRFGNRRGRKMEEEPAEP